MDNNMSRSNIQACAACKYQRRKCGSNCILAPYFPHDRQKQFLNAHRLFGVGKISNMLKPLDQHRRDLAMSTVIYESDMRARDPVGGCYRLVLQLQSQIEYACQELHLVLQHLAFFKAQSNPNPPSNNSLSHDLINATPHPPDQQLYQQQDPHHHQPHQQHPCFSYNSLQEDFNLLAIQNSVPLLPLSPLPLDNDINQDQDPVVDYGYDQKPGVLDLMKSDSNDKY